VAAGAKKKKKKKKGARNKKRANLIKSLISLAFDSKIT